MIRNFAFQDSVSHITCSMGASRLSEDKRGGYGIRCVKDYNNNILGITSGTINNSEVVATTTPTPTTNNTGKIQKIQDKDTLILKLQRKITALETKVVELEKRYVKKVDKKLSGKLAGKVLLQVENNGEAWYVDPQTKNKFYMKDGQSAYEILRAFGRGISNKDLSKIPIGYDTKLSEGLLDSDGDGLADVLEESIGTDPHKVDTDNDGYDDSTEVMNGFNPNGSGIYHVDKRFVEHIGNGIFLQVEDRGQAWLVKDGHRYYINSKIAYKAMHYLSLGINNNLKKIQVSEFAE